MENKTPHISLINLLVIEIILFINIDVILGRIYLYMFAAMSYLQSDNNYAMLIKELHFIRKP